ncbi:uncharacterized protein PHACADRAFT_208484 [Phanerochaete carnosa HHB-10118-sp]|uniref:Uncharacterized protein n=1 Tax=Phanerochaete carnosa (strain HHB-10118-sp) TaxID=650164 RepID=K5W712_PHACS|nr:uncharacterized protein PHACADRAFT_208484 [Phanerochaete carnosa HHB-10118-sp]EKM54940.1 hypothetical protein PHACADRAFT_208484 [Phanerochaete carnosa HHB-10118-sp]
MSSQYQKLKRSISHGVVKQITPCVAVESTQLYMNAPSPGTLTIPMPTSFDTNSDGSSIETADASATVQVDHLPVLASVVNFDFSLANLEKAVVEDHAPKHTRELAPPPYYKFDEASSVLFRRGSTEQDRSSGECYKCQGPIFGGRIHECLPKYWAYRLTACCLASCCKSINII